MAQTNRTSVLRWYTGARKGLPILIGKLPQGERLPGGPYTVGQLGAAGGVLVVGQLTKGVWGGWGGLADILVLLSVAVAAGAVWGYLPVEKWNPWGVLPGAQAAVSPARQGRIRGSAFKLPRVHAVKGRAAVGLADVRDLPDPLEVEPLVPAGVDVPVPVGRGSASRSTSDDVPARPARPASAVQRAWAARKDL